MCEYKQTPDVLLSAECIVRFKVQQQFSLIKKVVPSCASMRTLSQILLYEGRCAQVYWKVYASRLPVWVGFTSRKVKRDDGVNRLLNIGYHHLNNVVTKILSTHNVSPVLGFMHKARTEKSKPLVYDLMELFRADLVDREVLRFFRLKKKPVIHINQSDIGMFLKRLNHRMERKIYIKEFKQCHTYRYMMELQILKCISAVNHKEVFRPFDVPKRHESRCS